MYEGTPEIETCAIALSNGYLKIDDMQTERMKEKGLLKGLIARLTGATVLSFQRNREKDTKGEEESPKSNIERDE